MLRRALFLFASLVALAPGATAAALEVDVADPAGDASVWDGADDRRTSWDGAPVVRDEVDIVRLHTVLLNRSLFVRATFTGEPSASRDVDFAWYLWFGPSNASESHVITYRVAGVEKPGNAARRFDGDPGVARPVEVEALAGKTEVALRLAAAAIPANATCFMPVLLATWHGAPPHAHDRAGEGGDCAVDAAAYFTWEPGAEPGLVVVNGPPVERAPGTSEAPGVSIVMLAAGALVAVLGRRGRRRGRVGRAP